MNSVQCEAAHSFCDYCDLSSSWAGSPLASPDNKFLLYLNSEDVLSRRPWARVMWENKEQALCSMAPFQDLAYKNLDDSFCYVLNSVHKLVNLFIYMGRVACVYSHSILKCYQRLIFRRLSTSHINLFPGLSAPVFSIVRLHVVVTEHAVLLVNFEKFALECWKSVSKYIAVGFFPIRHSPGIYFRNSGIINVCCLLVSCLNNLLII
jgi:hypothetical protein